LHGGGWVLGNLDSQDALCRLLATRAQSVVASVDYRLAPEHPFPEALDDAMAALTWLREHIEFDGGDSSRVGVMGSSAGGNLAAAVSLRVRDAGLPPLATQILAYPVLDSGMKYRSYAEYASGYGLQSDQMHWYWDQYVPDKGRRRDPYASPMHAPSLRGMPSTLIVTAEFDLLRDEGRAYADRLRSESIEVDLVEYEGQVHGFLSAVGVMHDADRGVADIARWIRSRLCGSGSDGPHVK
jgi:acetyl esterase